MCACKASALLLSSPPNAPVPHPHRHPARGGEAVSLSARLEAFQSALLQVRTLCLSSFTVHSLTPTHHPPTLYTQHALTHALHNHCKTNQARSVGDDGLVEGLRASCRVMEIQITVHARMTKLIAAAAKGGDGGAQEQVGSVPTCMCVCVGLLLFGGRC